MAQQIPEDTAKRARQKTERVIKSLRPPTRTGRLIVWAAPFLVGPAVEYGVRLAEERGPGLAARGADIAKRKAPIAAHTAKETAAGRARRLRERRRSRPLGRTFGARGSGADSGGAGRGWSGNEEPTGWEREAP
jgi:hypothetical protein